MKQSSGDFSKETRQIYHKQHMRISKDGKAMERFINMFTIEYFGLGKDYFKGKKVLDAGCGDTGKVMIALSRMGAAEIYGIDLGEEFTPIIEENLKNYNVPLKSVILNSGSVLALPYEDDFFDFVVCHGVLLHLNNLDEVEIAFSELARITKTGGYLYVVCGLVGGLFEETIIPALRKYYTTNIEFRKYVDCFCPNDIHLLMTFIAERIKKHTGEDTDLSCLEELFDIDYCVFVQNFLQAPIRLEIKEDYIKERYLDNGFENIRRLKRYVKRQNIRKYFAPLHYEIDYSISKLLYGSGNLEFIGTKSRGQETDDWYSNVS